MKKILLMITVAVLAVSSIFLTIETATTGVEVARLEKTESTLIDQKRELEGTLVRTLSATKLQEKSVELGFIKPVDLVYVLTSPPVAKLP